MAEDKVKGAENEDVEDQTEEEESGAENEDKDGAKGSKETKENKDGGDKATKTFSQEQVSRMMTKEKNQGRQAALKELGLDPKDSKTLSMVKALIESQKTPEQKDAEKKAEDQSKVEEANHRALIAEAKAEAMQMGVKPQFVDDLVTLASAKLAEDGDMKTIIGEFKTKYPAWFGAADDDKDKDKKGQKGTGGSVKGSKDKDGKDKDSSLGARLAAQRKPTSGKKSYWGK